MTVRVGIVTISDRASQGVYQDLGGPAIRDCLQEILSCWGSDVARQRAVECERTLRTAFLTEGVVRRS